MKKILLTVLLIVSGTFFFCASAQVKKGYNFGVLPAVSFDADKGFQYGIITNIYDYGDGSNYPSYDQSLYLEASWTTKKNSIYRAYYNTEKWLPGYKVSLDFSYMPDPLCEFFGFNGYQSKYNCDWVDSKNENYLTRAFYRRRSDLTRGMADIQGKITGNLYWNAGIGVLSYKTGEVDLDKTDLPKDQTDLYSLYREWGLIDDKEAEGGTHPYIRAGVNYDSRDIKANPGHGIYADAFITYSAAFGDLKGYDFAWLNLDFRHYLTLVSNRLTLAYRVCSQSILFGNSPFYMNNYLNVLHQQRDIYDALGGKNSLRGVLRNRILSDGYVYATIELRSRLANFDIGKQHFYFGLNPFIDAGMVTKERKVDENIVMRSYYIMGIAPKSATRKIIDQGYDLDDFFDFDTNVHTPHVSAGLGAKVAMNENFILSIDWALPLNKQDNSKMANLYIALGYLF